MELLSNYPAMPAFFHPPLIILAPYVSSTEIVHIDKPLCMDGGV